MYLLFLLLQTFHEKFTEKINVERKNRSQLLHKYYTLYSYIRCIALHYV